MSVPQLEVSQLNGPDVLGVARCSAGVGLLPSLAESFAVADPQDGGDEQQHDFVERAGDGQGGYGAAPAERFGDALVAHDELDGAEQAHQGGARQGETLAHIVEPSLIGSRTARWRSKNTSRPVKGLSAADLAYYRERQEPPA